MVRVRAAQVFVDGRWKASGENVWASEGEHKRTLSLAHR